MSRRLALVLVVLLAGAAVAGFVALALGDDPPEDRRDEVSDTTTTTAAPLDEAAQELLARLEAGRAAPVHVRLEDTAATAEGTSTTVEIWRDGDRVRQDLVLVAPGVRTELRAFQLPDGNVICQRAGEAEWQCEGAISTATENGEPAGIVEAAAANLEGAEVTTSDEEILDRPVRCYAIEGASGASSMCVTDDGVPMRLGVQGQELTATAVDDVVDASVFEPPAEVTPAG